MWQSSCTKPSQMVNRWCMPLPPGPGVYSEAIVESLQFGIRGFHAQGRSRIRSKLHLRRVTKGVQHALMSADVNMRGSMEEVNGHFRDWLRTCNIDIRSTELTFLYIYMCIHLWVCRRTLFIRRQIKNLSFLIGKSEVNVGIQNLSILQ